MVRRLPDADCDLQQQFSRSPPDSVSYGIEDVIDRRHVDGRGLSRFGMNPAAIEAHGPAIDANAVMVGRAIPVQKRFIAGVFVKDRQIVPSGG